MNVLRPDQTRVLKVWGKIKPLSSVLRELRPLPLFDALIIIKTQKKPQKLTKY